MEAETAFAQARSKCESDQVESGLEKPLSLGDGKALKEAWGQPHSGKPCKSMKPAPKLKNRMFCEFEAHAVTLYTTDKAVTIEDTKRPQEATRVPVGSGVAGDEQPELLLNTSLRCAS